MKRWIIRSFFIGLLLLCMGGWVVTAKYQCFIAYRHGGHAIDCNLYLGVICVVFVSSATGPTGWDHFVICLPHARFWPPELFWDHHMFWGFGFDHRASAFTRFAVPYWFTILVSAALLWLVWRKTRPKPKGRAFPVEPSKPIAEQGGKAE